MVKHSKKYFKAPFDYSWEWEETDRQLKLYQKVQGGKQESNQRQSYQKTWVNSFCYHVNISVVAWTAALIQLFFNLRRYKPRRFQIIANQQRTKLPVGVIRRRKS